MGNICPCLKSDAAERNEYTPIAPTETTQTRPSRPSQEKNTNNYQIILEKATNDFLFTKPRQKEQLTSEGIDAIRSRMQSAKVDQSTILSTSPVIIRPFPVTSSNEDYKSTLVKNLSKPSTSAKRQDTEKKATELANIFTQHDNNYVSYQQESLPLVSFKNGNEK